jgi:DNA polymerase III gamma/tau subunit
MLRNRPLRLLEVDNGSNPAGGASQADASTTNPTPQAGDTTTSTPSQAGDTTTSTPSQADESHNKPPKSIEDLERMIAELRKENAGHRTKLKKFEDEERQRTEAQMSEQERLKKQYEELQAEHNDVLEAQFEQMIDREIERAAIKAGVKPNLLEKVGKLLDWEDIDIDEDSGTAKNIADLVGQLVKDMPELLGKVAPSSGGATNPSRSTSSAPKELTWEVISAMKPDEYAARRAEIQQFMLNNPMRYGTRSRH